MKEEISAGGVVLKYQPLGWQVLMIRDMNDTWTFAKGIIEPGESALDAAIREIREETGVTNLSFIDELPTVQYYYKRNGLIHKSVKYFLFETKYSGGLSPQASEGIKEAKWVPVEQAAGIIGYPDTNKKITQILSQKIAQMSPEKAKNNTHTS